MKTQDVAVSIPALLKWLLAIVATFWLGIPGPMRTLVVFMAIDYVTGMIAAFHYKRWSSSAGWWGLAKKGFVVLLLLTVRYAEQATNSQLGLDHIGAIGYIINELISIVENFAMLGVPIPAQLVDALLLAKQLKMHRASSEQLRQLAEERTDEAIREERLASAAAAGAGDPPARPPDDRASGK